MAACSLAALSMSPGLPTAPTATAFHAFIALPIRCARLFRSSGAMEALPLIVKKPVAFIAVGIGTTKDIDRDDHAGSACVVTAEFQSPANGFFG
jgi:hypothetical protein